jgi:hypothetical protein
MTADVNFAELAKRYCAIFNEPDADVRETEVAGIWSADAYVCTQGAGYSGRPAIIGRVAAAYDKWVRAGGYVFRQLGEAEGHHGAIRLRWEMVPAAGGAAALAGVQFLILDDDGLVRSDHQFIDM